MFYSDCRVLYFYLLFRFLRDEAVIVAPDGYERSWNVYSGLFSRDLISIHSARRAVT